MDLDLRHDLRSRPLLAMTWDALLMELLASWRQLDDARRTDAPLDDRLRAFHRHEEARTAIRSFAARPPRAN